MEQHVKKRHSRSSLMYKKIDANSPSIMQSLDSITVLEQNKNSEDLNVELCMNQQSIDLEKHFESLNLASKDDANRSFQIIDNRELLQVNYIFKLKYMTSAIIFKINFRWN